MQKCPSLDLARLPKGTGVKSVRFKRATPGSAASVFGRGWAWNPLDPSHPASQLPRQTLTKVCPRYTNPVLRMRAVPKAALDKPEFRYPNPPFSLTSPTEWSITMSLNNVVAQRDVLKTAHVRNRIVRKVKTAVNLIVARGAAVGLVDGKKQLVMNDKEDYSQFILQDWSYIVSPKMEVYRMEYPDLVEILRDALRTMHKRAVSLETEWSRLAPVSKVSKPNTSESWSLAKLQAPSDTPSPTVGSAEDAAFDALWDLIPDSGKESGISSTDDRLAELERTLFDDAKSKPARPEKSSVSSLPSKKESKSVTNLLFSKTPTVIKRSIDAKPARQGGQSKKGKPRDDR